MFKRLFTCLGWLVIFAVVLACAWLYFHSPLFSHLHLFL
jgi:hypothetical protein